MMLTLFHWERVDGANTDRLTGGRWVITNDDGLFERFFPVWQEAKEASGQGALLSWYTLLLS